MLDLLITNATLPDGRTGMSVAVQDGCIAESRPDSMRLRTRSSTRRACCYRPTSSTRTSTWTPR